MAQPARSSQVMVALQTKDGLAFGYCFDLSGDDVQFEVNSNLAPGEEMAFRMELKGYEETVMGALRVTQAFPPGASGWPHFRGKVLSIPDDDRKLLEVWMEDQRSGGSSRRMERDPDAYVKDMFAKRMSGATNASTKLVIDRMNERKARRDRLFKKTDDVFKKQMELDASVALGVARTTGEHSRESIRQAISKPAEPAPAPEGDDGMDLFDLDDLD
ncbi:MAG: hypothetical protein ABIO70_19860 [Pseudomonadota bacterium]